MTTDEPLPRALEILWRDAPPARRTRGLSRERSPGQICATAVTIATLANVTWATSNG